MKEIYRFGIRDLAFIAAICIFCFIKGVSTFGTGAPLSTCFTRYPKHRHTPTQTTDSPYRISFNAINYSPGDNIEVTISGPNDRPFKGFEMAGFRESDGSGNGENCESLEIVGQFTKYDDPPGKAKAFACGNGIQNLITHSNKDPAVTTITFVWSAPSYNAGNIKFKATVVENFRTFWTDMEAVLPVNQVGLGPPRAPVYPPLCTRSIVKDVGLSGCEDNKSCFLYPRHCQDTDCVAAVSFQYNATTDDYLVEMYAEPGPSPVGYVGVAFSSDDVMGDDETFVCAEASVQHGYNPAKHNERIVSTYLSNAEVKHEDGRLQCRFVMRHDGQAIRVKSSTATSENPEQINQTYDKDNGWRIQLAWGPVMPDSNVITKHKDMPATTSSSVMIKEAGLHRGTAYHVLIQVHAAFMIVAWTFLSGIVTVVARHYKDMMPRKRLCGTKIWFQVHRGLAILVAVMTGIGLIVIFSHFEWEITEAAVPHAYWGLAVAVAVGLQIIAGLLRPGPDHKLRIFFNWGHRLLGQASHVLAAVTMFLAFEIEYVTKSMHTFGFTTLGIWVGVQLMWHICFEIVSFIFKRNASDSYQVDKGNDENESWIPAVLMIIYVTFLAACCISVLCAFLFF